MSITNKRDMLFRKQQGRAMKMSFQAEVDKIVLPDCHDRAVTISLEETDDVMAAASVIATSTRRKWNSKFDDKSNLVRLMDTIANVDDQSVYILTAYSELCGGILAPSIRCINVDFKFQDEHAGIITIISKDLFNKLVIDFYEEKKEHLLEIEVCGPKWTET